ncbi:cuticle protein 16.5 [Anopheles marshallii]|uniref:cuticle protein 16.5 n=1 Tax=Anopheles marshallii TaxID=1521116 RepID=UPI00237A0A7B|nr:cuticle protein 16.5 [Anopheles marshallii]
MAFKFVILAALVAAVSAGGPAAYSIAAPSVDYHSVGASHEHTVKGLYGQNVLSQYSKAVDSAHSSVRVHSSRLSNDGFAYAPAVKYAAPAYAAHYAAPAVHYPAAAHYAAPAVHYPAAHYAAPAVHYPAAHYAAPAVHYAAHAPIVKAAYPAIAAPLAYKAPLAAPVAAVHGGSVVQFAGLGASYAW